VLSNMHQHLKKKSEKLLIQHLKIGTVLDVVTHAFQFDRENLFEASKEFIVQHFDHIGYGPRWERFARDQPVVLRQILLHKQVLEAGLEAVVGDTGKDSTEAEEQMHDSSRGVSVDTLIEVDCNSTGPLVPDFLPIPSETLAGLGILDLNLEPTCLETDLVPSPAVHLESSSVFALISVEPSLSSPEHYCVDWSRADLLTGLEAGLPNFVDLPSFSAASNLIDFETEVLASSASLDCIVERREDCQVPKVGAIALSKAEQLTLPDPNWREPIRGQLSRWKLCSAPTKLERSCQEDIKLL